MNCQEIEGEFTKGYHFVINIVFIQLSCFSEP